jgi:hypothetical protein
MRLPRDQATIPAAGVVRRNIFAAPVGLMTPDQPIRMPDTRQALAPLRANVVSRPSTQVPGVDMHNRAWFDAWQEAENTSPH